MFVQEIKILLGGTADNYSDELIGLVCKQAIQFVESYTNRTLDYELEIAAKRIALTNLNRIGTEGLASQSYSGVSETYVDGLPADIISVLNRKRRIKVI